MGVVVGDLAFYIQQGLCEVFAKVATQRQTGSSHDKATLASSSSQSIRRVESDSRKRCDWGFRHEGTVPIWFSLNVE